MTGDPGAILLNEVANAFLFLSYASAIYLLLRDFGGFLNSLTTHRGWFIASLCAMGLGRLTAVITLGTGTMPLQGVILSLAASITVTTAIITARDVWRAR
jgi:hypothetical protein